MKHNKLKKSIILISFLAASIPFAVHAGGVIQLPQTGQTDCYDASGAVITCPGTGQDGEFRPGAAWPNPRFTDKGDQTVMDNLTGLVWTKDGNLMKTRDPGFDGDSIDRDGAVTWQHALDYIAKLNQENYLGHNDWRLPNIKELESLVHVGQSNVATWLNLQGFSNVQSGYYWSSSSQAGYTSIKWAVDMYAGYVKYSSYSYVWPVRSGQAGSLDSSTISLPRTGQTVCYNSVGCSGTGQDGELRMGVAWPNPRFTGNGDQTVMDNLTGLVWTKDGKTPGPTTCGSIYDTLKNWREALDYVKCLNTNNYLGHNDWRLPNVKELDSLVHVGQSSIATWLNLQGFSNVQSGYWSSDTYAYIADFAWEVSMFDGERRIVSKSGISYVWPVRSEKSGSPIKLTANAGPNQIVFDKVTLDGSTSEGSIISWNWTLTHQGNPAYRRTATGQKPSIDNLEAGFYDVRLTVSDGITTSTATSLLAVAGRWDVNGDSKIGLAEAIFILQKAAGMR